MTYEATRDRLEVYFDKTAAKAWEAITSDAPVSRIRQTVRAGRDAMRAELLNLLPADLSGARVLDAGCGPGQLSEALALRGATVVGVDISPSLIDVARQRIAPEVAHKVAFQTGDMLSVDLGRFDHVVAMDSLIHYAADDIALALDKLAVRTSESIVFTVAPKTPLLMAMWWAGKAFPRSDRSPAIRPHSTSGLNKMMGMIGSGIRLTEGARVNSGFYISQAMEARK